MDRRNFIALSAVATASTAVLGKSPIATVTTGFTTGMASDASIAGIPLPSLARVQANNAKLTSARLIPTQALGLSDHARITNPTLTIEPLPCLANRVESDAGFDIEVFYPQANTHSIIYSAHNAGIGAFPAGLTINAPTDRSSKVTLKITQRDNQNKNQNQSKNQQSHQLIIDAARDGIYILAVPTASNSSHANWRMTRVETSPLGRPTQITNALPAASSGCAYLCITIKEHTQDTGAHHAK